MPHAKPDDYRKLIDALKQLSPDEFRSVAIACNHGGNGGVRGKLINMLRQDQMMKERPAKTVENFVKSELKRIRGVEKRVPRALQYDEELSEEWMLLYQRVKALQEEEENERKAAAGQALIRNVDNHRARDGELHPKSNKPKPTPMPISCGLQATNPPRMPEPVENYCYGPDANGWKQNSKRVDSTTDQQHKKAAKGGTAAVLHEYSTKFQEPGPTDSTKFSQTHDVGKEGSLKGFSLVTVEGMALEADGTTSYDQVSDAFKEYRMAGGMSDDQLPKMVAKKSSTQVEMADSGSGGACDFTKATVTGKGGSLPGHDPHAEAPQTLSGSSPPKPSAIFCKASCGFEALHPPFVPEESGSNYFHSPDATGKEENPEKMKWKERGNKNEPRRVHPSSGTNKDHIKNTAPTTQQNLASRETVGWNGENCEDGVLKEDLMKELAIYKDENLRLKDELSTCQLENAQLRMENQHVKEVDKTNKELIARLREMEQVIKAQKAMIDAIQSFPGGTTDDASADA